jgi:hypothetical protein
VVGGKGGIGFHGAATATCPPPVVGGNGGIGFHGAAKEALPLPTAGKVACMELVVDAFACERAKIAKSAPSRTLRIFIVLIIVLPLRNCFQK